MRRIASRRKTSQHCTLRNGDPSSDIESLSRKHTLKDTEDRPRVVAVKKTDEAEGMTFLLYLPFFLPILSTLSIKDSLAPLVGPRLQPRPLYPVGRVQRRELLRPDHNVQLLQVQLTSVLQLARSEKPPPQNPLHGLPHDLKHLAYPQPLRDL